jgi:hypothetical protein
MQEHIEARMGALVSLAHNLRFHHWIPDMQAAFASVVRTLSTCSRTLCITRVIPFIPCYRHFELDAIALR